MENNIGAWEPVQQMLHEMAQGKVREGGPVPLTDHTKKDYIWYQIEQMCLINYYEIYTSIATGQMVHVQNKVLLSVTKSSIIHYMLWISAFVHNMIMYTLRFSHLRHGVCELFLLFLLHLYSYFHLGSMWTSLAKWATPCIVYCRANSERQTSIHTQIHT